MKKLAILVIALFLCTAVITQAALVPISSVYDTVSNIIQQIPNAANAGLRAAFFNATSTTGTSTFAGNVSISKSLSVSGTTTLNAMQTYVHGIGTITRPLFSTTTRVIEVGVGKECTTIQCAANKLPVFVSNKVRINIDPGTYNEDVIIPPMYGAHVASSSIEITSVESIPFSFTGDIVDPSLVQIRSLYIQGLQGGRFAFQGFTITGSNDYDNEGAGISVYGSEEVEIKFIDFAAGQRGIMCYSSFCFLANIDFGSNVLSSHGISVKHGGYVAQETLPGFNSLTGTVGGYGFEVQNGDILFYSASNTGDFIGNDFGINSGTLYDGYTNKDYNTTSFNSNIGIGTETPDQRLDVEGSIVLGNNEQMQFRGSAAQVSSIRTVGTQDLTFRVANTDRMTIATNGNVGIATSSPSSLFTVAGDILGTANLSLSSSTSNINLNPAGAATDVNALLVANSRASFGYDGTRAYIGSGGGRDIVFKPAGSEKIRITSAGLFGINTTVPSTTLHVIGTTTTSNLALTGALTDSTSAIGSNGNVLISTGTSTRWVATSSLGISGGGGASASGTINTGVTGQIAYYAAGGTDLTGSSAVFVNSSGTIGIGTTTIADGELEVQSGILGGIIARFFGSTGSTSMVVTEATTTVRHSSSLAGFLQASLARITVGIDSLIGYYRSGRLFGALTIKGLFYQEEWNQVDCSSPVSATQISADVLTGCDGFSFFEDNTATFTSTANGGNIYGRMSTSATADGAGIFLNAPASGGLIFASSTPVFEATARIHTVQNQGTTTQTFIGFSNLSTTGTTFETAPTAGCFFTASTTQANWRAICRTALANQTNVDTGIASTTVTTGDGVPYRFMIEADADGAKFYIQTSEAGSLTNVANITTTVPTTTAMNAGVHFGRAQGVTAVGVDVYDMNIGWRKMLAR